MPLLLVYQKKLSFKILGAACEDSLTRDIPFAFEKASNKK